MHRLMSTLIYPSVLTVCFLFVLQAASHAGQVPDGLAGVPWGATRDQVKKIMIEKGFKQEEAMPFSNLPSPGLVFYGPLANRMCYLEFMFKGNAFDYGSIAGKSYNYETVLETYNYFVKLVTAKYGIPQEQKCIRTTTGACGSYFTKWKFVDNASSDVYAIDSGAAAPVADMYESSGKPIYDFFFNFSAVSFGNRLKEDGI